MPIEERADSVAELSQWTDSIPFQYQYTAGVAGERFLRGLIDGRILAGYCPRCEEASLPARIYCVKCYGEITRYVRAGPAGRVAAITRKRGDEEGAQTFVYVEFKGVRGGMIHKLLGKGRAGSRVVPRFKPRRERTGSILDIQGFESIS